MTMTRTTKAKHNAALAPGPITGYTRTQFASPRLIGAARTERGHIYMTAAEYVEHRMSGRRVTPVPATEIRHLAAAARNGQRTVVRDGNTTHQTRRDLRPAVWGGHEVVRRVKRKPVKGKA